MARIKKGKCEDAKLLKFLSQWSAWSVMVPEYNHNTMTQWMWAWWKSDFGTGHVRTRQIVCPQKWFSIKLPICHRFKLGNGQWAMGMSSMPVWRAIASQSHDMGPFSRGSEPELQNINVFKWIYLRESVTFFNSFDQSIPVSVLEAPPSSFTHRGST